MQTNIRWLRQAVEVLDGIDDQAYADAGGQFRHVVEFYECFLEGLRRRHVDYDARRRDCTVQAHRVVALSRCLSLIQKFETESLPRIDTPICLQVEDSPGLTVTSTVGRELQALSSHTVHHFALISMILKARGALVDSSFGVAPSTLRHRSQLAEAA